MKGRPVVQVGTAPLVEVNLLRLARYDMNLSQVVVSRVHVVLTIDTRCKGSLRNESAGHKTGPICCSTPIIQIHEIALRID